MQLANGEPQYVLGSFQRAASLQRSLGDRAREALAWHGAGEAHRELDDRWRAALALDGLSAALREADKTEEVRRHWAEALRALASYVDPGRR